MIKETRLCRVSFIIRERQVWCVAGIVTLALAGTSPAFSIKHHQAILEVGLWRLLRNKLRRCCNRWRLR